MTLSTRAACLSAFLFPGSGHLLLKFYLRGGLLITIAAIGLLLFMVTAFDIALNIAEDIEAGNIAFDSAAMLRVIQESLATFDQAQFTVAKYAFIISWLLGIFDAWRLARLRETINDKVTLS